jgi:GH35 family endo-1,4-beta-xylanase
MGDLEYVRNAVMFARQNFKGNPEDLKLFVNDYNLESDWDDNKKLKSLIKWIEKWEADGVTKIDGIGTQMHISCFEDAGIQKGIEEHIVKMFRLMAATGKLVRISELDMGYIRGSQRWNVPSVQTPNMTEAEHKKMADFYQFIVKKYLEIIPKDQQYGICQWCLTDAPAEPSYVWRRGEPVGLWTENFAERKVTYDGFAAGLSEQ